MKNNAESCTTADILVHEIQLFFDGSSNVLCVRMKILLSHHSVLLSSASWKRKSRNGLYNCTIVVSKTQLWCLLFGRIKF